MGGRLHIGAILHLYCSFTRPPKDKFLIVVCLDPKPLLVFINSRINALVQSNPDLAQCQVLIDAENHAFLDYDSFIDCSDVCSFPIEHLEGQVEEQLKGTVSSGVLSGIGEVIQKSPLISPRQLSWIAQALKG